MTSASAQAPLHHDGQFVIRLAPAQRPESEATAWLDSNQQQQQQQAQPQLQSHQQPQQQPQAEMRRKPKRNKVPSHPIPTMQEAFAESLAEVNSGAHELKPQLRDGDAKARREKLLDQDKSAGPPNALWRLRPGQKCHELRKLMAQISFGVYLLLHGMANSNAQVVSILQGHIDEVDEFLECTMEDFKLATQDLNKRLEYLKLPMDNMPVFEQMLEDRNFRLQIVEGNLKIEHILARTTTALLQSVQDISEGLKSTKEFTTYLASEQNAPWRKDRPDVIDIYEAMRGNTEGWLNAFSGLQAKSNMLNALVSKLNGMIAEMDNKAGEVSRRTRFTVQPFTSPTESLIIPRSPPQSPPQSPRSTAGSEGTPPASPPAKVSRSPPRLSLRFSRLPEERPSGPTYFNLPAQDGLFGRDGLPSVRNSLVQAFEMDKEVRGATPELKLDLRFSHQELPESPESPAPAATAALASVPEQEPDRELDEGARLEISPVVRVSEETAAPEPEVEESPVYLLQPRTYTPQPPAPLPSPRMKTERSPPAVTVSLARDDVVAPRAASPPPPIQERSRLRKQASQPALVEVRPVRRVPSRTPDEARPSTGSMILGNQAYRARDSARESRLEGSRTEQEQEQEQERDSFQPKQRTSLRQRVSLKTTPPASIQVPPPDAELQRPVFASPRTYQSYRTYQGPDSAYGSDPDRTAVNSVADPAVADLSPPVFPGIIPSPHSDQQYFRPVKASPHSPLQQRPHTAGHVTPRPYHQRNAPSTMGMSMLSAVTTLNPDSKSGRTLKKKRSAFGWLKKAFTLDEEERANFDQRKNAEMRNPYYDGRSPKFLDGKRVR